MERHMTEDLHRSSQGIRATIERSSLARGILKVMGVLAGTVPSYACYIRLH